MNQLLQIDVAQLGVGTSTELSERPNEKQRIVIDYLMTYAYCAAVTDLLQIDIYGQTVRDRKTLFYLQPTAAVHYAPCFCTGPICLNPGEYIQVYGKGMGATSNLTAILWYHIEDMPESALVYDGEVDAPRRSTRFPMMIPGVNI